MIHELRSPIYVRVLSKDGAEARTIAWSDYGPDSVFLWKVVMMHSGKVWDVKQEDIEVCENWSMDY